jgi:hypothetical protein
VAKIHLDRLRKRHGYTGEAYKELMGKIITENTESIAHAIGRITSENFKTKLKNYRAAAKIFTLPDITEAVPKRSVFIRKGAERGTILTDDLRTALAKNLREVLSKPEYIVGRGKYAGRLKQGILFDFQDKIKETFEGYVKRDKLLGMPRNIYSIATTEIRPVVAQVKQGYVANLRKKNPDIDVTKTWLHNMTLLKDRKNARPHHVALNGVSVAFDEDFVVKDKEIGITYRVPHPHHESLPAEQVISCQCEVVYRIRKK